VDRNSEKAFSIRHSTSGEAKLRFNYGVTESQLIRYVREARKVKGSTGEVLLQLLEMRLDNILFRLGFTPTIASARQAIRHGHIVVNDRKATIPSYQCHPQDTILISPKNDLNPSWTLGCKGEIAGLCHLIFASMRRKDGSRWPGC
jgi:small subunit ribosomal protein S4